MLRRLYEPGQLPPALGGAVSGPISAAETSPEAAIKALTDNLLDAVFQISEFDPLPNIDQYQDFGLGLIPVVTRADLERPVEGGRTSPVLPVRPIPDGSGVPAGGATSTSGIDRRQLPRRESECIVAVWPCLPDERLTAERILWKLHAAQLKGQLFDVSMSGIAVYLPSPLQPGVKVLLRISNRTIDRHVDTAAIVLRCRQSVEGGWNIVCRFHKNLSFEQIHVVGRSLFASTIV
jgi:PilZ domain